MSNFIIIMRNLLTLIVGILIYTVSYPKDLPEGYPSTERSKTKINASWKFHLGDPDVENYRITFDDSKWKGVCVPHTFKLTSISLDGSKDDKYQKTFQREVGWYRKSILIPNDANKKVFLYFEGAHQVTDVWVNGKHVGQNSIGGYTPFQFDITRYAEFGKSNQITLRINNRVNETTPPDPGMADYVRFSGFYRDVYLIETNQLHITNNIEAANAGVAITTPSVDPVNMNATIDIKTEVKNESSKARKATVINRIVDEQGIVVLKLIQEATILAGAVHHFDQIGGIEENLHLWSIDDPYLYHVNTLILENGKPIDCVDNPLGIRKFKLDKDKGFMLNGKPIELIGFNRHQHYGYIGDAMPNSLHYKDMLQFKQMGFNVVRTAHYPQDDALVNACDKLGILVYEEAPSWIMISQNQTWYDNMEQAARTMVRNHRNHPSVVIWGAGINHRGYVPQIHYAIKQEDPTRFTASQSSRWTGWQASGLTDIFANMLYGPVTWDRQEPLLAMEGRYGPAEVAKYKRDPLLLGLISWTAHAYYTFHDMGNPLDRTRGGVFNVFRYTKVPSVWWYPTELKKRPQLYIRDPWIEGTTTLTVYSNCQKVELLINDKQIGIFSPSTDPKYDGLDHPPFEIPINHFEKGKLMVKGTIDGRVLAEQTIYTPENPVAIRLVADTTGRSFVADGTDILVAYAEIIDSHGTIIDDANQSVTFKVKGPASIVGENANIGANPEKAEHGVAPVLIRAGKTPGSLTISASVDGLKTGSAKVNTVADETNMILKDAYPIYDLEKVKVDMGAPDQLLQFGWYPWNGEDNQSSEITIPAFGGVTASIHPASPNGVLRWLGEMNVIGKFGYVYGEGVLGIDKQGIVLELKNLPAGNYQIKTYHHAPISNTDSMDPNREKLKTLKINKIPHAQKIEAEVSFNGTMMDEKPVNVTSGSNLQYQNPGTALLHFRSDGKNPVKINFTSLDQTKGIWLNGFELMQQP